MCYLHIIIYLYIYIYIYTSGTYAQARNQILISNMLSIIILPGTGEGQTDGGRWGRPIKSLRALAT